MPDHLFQPWFVELLSVVSNLAVGVSAIFAAVLAFSGLRQWRAELVGRTRFDLARRIAKLAYQFQDQMHSARFPFTMPGEAANRERAEGESPELTAVEDEMFARFERLRPVRDTVRDLHEAGWEAEIALDPEVTRLIKRIEEVSVQARTAAYRHFGRAREAAKNNQPLEEPTGGQRIVYGERNDEFGQVIDQAVDNLVHSLKTYIR